jgi:hypothetical protein
VRRGYPLNCETPLPALTGGVVMPNARFYVRYHFGISGLDPGGWRSIPVACTGCGAFGERLA